MPIKRGKHVKSSIPFISLDYICIPFFRFKDYLINTKIFNLIKSCIGRKKIEQNFLKEFVFI